MNCCYKLLDIVEIVENHIKNAGKTARKRVARVNRYNNPSGALGVVGDRLPSTAVTATKNVTLQPNRSNGNPSIITLTQNSSKNAGKTSLIKHNNNQQSDTTSANIASAQLPGMNDFR